MEETAQGRFKDETQDVESYFEAQLNRPCIAVSSGTAALHVALRLLSLKPGSEIIIPTLTYAACANAVLYEGLKPVFCDVNPQTWCLGCEELGATLESRCKDRRRHARSSLRPSLCHAGIERGLSSIWYSGD